LSDKIRQRPEVTVNKLFGWHGSARQANGEGMRQP